MQNYRPLECENLEELCPMALYLDCWVRTFLAYHEKDAAVSRTQRRLPSKMNQSHLHNEQSTCEVIG